MSALLAEEDTGAPASAGQRIAHAAATFHHRPQPAGLNRDGRRFVREDGTRDALAALLGALSSYADAVPPSEGRLAELVERVLRDAATRECEEASRYAAMPTFAEQGSPQ